MWFCFFFFFKQKTAYEMRISDWSSDVCSSDLAAQAFSRVSWTRSSARSARPVRLRAKARRCGMTVSSSCLHSSRAATDFDFAVNSASFFGAVIISLVYFFHPIITRVLQRTVTHGAIDAVQPFGPVRLYRQAG